MHRLTNFITAIPDDLKFALKDIAITKKNIHISLGTKYDKDIIVETISLNFTKFKSNLKKSLKEKGVETEDIAKIISLIENNHTLIFPDIENAVATASDIGEKDSPILKPDISFEE
jgi:hypothetical protein